MIFWLFVGVGIGAILFQGELNQVVEALYSIPPTPAFETIHIIENDTLPYTAVTNINASVFNDDFRFISDGSISAIFTVSP